MPMSEAPSKHKHPGRVRSPQSERQRRLRARRRAGLAVVPVTVDMAAIEVLIDLNWLPIEVSESRDGIGEAVARMLADLARSKKV